MLSTCQKALRLLEYASLPCISMVKLYVQKSKFGGETFDRLRGGAAN